MCISAVLQQIGDNDGRKKTSEMEQHTGGARQGGKEVAMN